MRLVVRLMLGLTILTAACTGGPDCVQACDFATHCAGLTKTFYLTCSNLSYGCADDGDGGFGLGSCATCLNSAGMTCASLIAGQCDPQCVPGYVPDGGVLDAGP
jgi:hypothetical protein